MKGVSLMPEQNPGLDDLLEAASNFVPPPPRWIANLIPQPDFIGETYRTRVLPGMVHWDGTAIADLNGPLPSCGNDCSYGGCWGGCGSCCYCMGGCVVEWENYQTAPFLWEGDYA